MTSRAETLSRIEIARSSEAVRFRRCISRFMQVTGKLNPNSILMNTRF